MAKAAIDKTAIRRIVGQDRTRRLLAETLQTNRTAHAYLLSGPRGVGKAAIVLEFARLLLCESGETAPCEKCIQCRLSESLQHPDLHLVFPLPPGGRSSVEGDTDDETEALSGQITRLISSLARDPYTTIELERSKSKTDSRASRGQEHTIKIAQIRSLLRMAALKPFQAARKVFVLFRADMMNANAQNAFLKVLEEPPESAILLLTTEHELLLRATVRSRCQRVAVSPLLSEEISSALREEGVPEARAVIAASLSGGSFVHARELAAGELEQMQGRVIDFLKAAALCDPLRLPDVCNALLENNSLPRETALELLSMFLRDVALHRSNPGLCNSNLTFQSYRQAVGGVHTAFPGADLESALTAVDESAAFLSRGYTENFVLYALAVRLRECLGPRASSKRKNSKVSSYA